MHRAPRVLCPQGSDQETCGRFQLDDTFGALTDFSESNLFSALMRKHNEPEDAHHFRLFEFLVLGSQVTAERDLVLITFGSVSMILNAFRAIIAGWGFQ